MIRAIHDVKGIDMGSYLVRYKAELDFDGRELTRAYLDKQDLNELLQVNQMCYKISLVFSSCHPSSFLFTMTNSYLLKRYGAVLASKSQMGFSICSGYRFHFLLLFHLCIISL